MERGFTAYSECSNIGTIRMLKWDLKKKKHSKTSALDDECATAADTYKCGAEKVPDIVQDMVDVAKGSPALVILKSLNF
jgi:hypothetical protein